MYTMSGVGWQAHGGAGNRSRLDLSHTQQLFRSLLVRKDPMFIFFSAPDSDLVYPTRPALTTTTEVNEMIVV